MLVNIMTILVLIFVLLVAPEAIVMCLVATILIAVFTVMWFIYKEKKNNEKSQK